MKRTKNHQRGDHLCTASRCTEWWGAFRGPSSHRDRMQRMPPKPSKMENIPESAQTLQRTDISLVRAGLDEMPCRWVGGPPCVRGAVFISGFFRDYGRGSRTCAHTHADKLTRNLERGRESVRAEVGPAEGNWSVQVKWMKIKKKSRKNGIRVQRCASLFFSLSSSSSSWSPSPCSCRAIGRTKKTGVTWRAEADTWPTEASWLGVLGRRTDATRSEVDFGKPRGYG